MVVLVFCLAVGPTLKRKSLSLPSLSLFPPFSLSLPLLLPLPLPLSLPLPLPLPLSLSLLSLYRVAREGLTMAARDWDFLSLFVLFAVPATQPHGRPPMQHGRVGGVAVRQQLRGVDQLILWQLLTKEEVHQSTHALHGLMKDGREPREERGEGVAPDFGGRLLEGGERQKNGGSGELHGVAQRVQHAEPALDQRVWADSLQDVGIVRILLGEGVEVGQAVGGVEVAEEGEGEGVHESAPLGGQTAVLPPAQAELAQRLPQLGGWEEKNAGPQPDLEEHVDELVGEHGAQAELQGVQGRGEEDISHREQVSGDGLPGLLTQFWARPQDE